MTPVSGFVLHPVADGFRIVPSPPTPREITQKQELRRHGVVAQLSYGGQVSGSLNPLGTKFIFPLLDATIQLPHKERYLASYTHLLLGVPSL